MALCTLQADLVVSFVFDVANESERTRKCGERHRGALTSGLEHGKA